MNFLIFNDQAHISEQFQLVDDHTTQIARLAFHKIHAYKLSLGRESYCMNREDLDNLIKGTLMNYVPYSTVLQQSGFFSDEIDN